MNIVKMRYSELDYIYKKQIALLEGLCFGTEFSIIYEADVEVFVIFIADVGFITYKDIGMAMDVYNCCVFERFRGLGYGVEMFELLQKEGKDLILEVRISNLRARCFYEKLGFELVREIKNYYQSESAYVLMWRFNGS